MRTYAGAPRAWHGPFGLPPLWSKPALPSPFAMSVILPYIAPLLLLLETNTEANIAEADAGGVVAAHSRTKVRPNVVPGATPYNPRRARCRPSGINHRVAAGIGRLVPVCGPLPHISMHIKKAPGVGRVLPHITGLFKIASVISTAVPIIIRIRAGNGRSP